MMYYDLWVSNIDTVLVVLQRFKHRNLSKIVYEELSSVYVKTQIIFLSLSLIIDKLTRILKLTT